MSASSPASAEDVLTISLAADTRYPLGHDRLEPRCCSCFAHPRGACFGGGSQASGLFRDDCEKFRALANVVVLYVRDSDVAVALRGIAERAAAVSELLIVTPLDALDATLAISRRRPI